jgi:hypothetical protein
MLDQSWIWLVNGLKLGLFVVFYNPATNHEITHFMAHRDSKGCWEEPPFSAENLRCSYNLAL